MERRRYVLFYEAGEGGERDEDFRDARATGSQFIVYEMRVSAQEPAAMVLPVPVDQSKGEKALRFIDLKEYPRFFDDFDRLFWQPTKGDSRAATGQFMGMTGSIPLPVERVGAFDAS